MTRPIERISRIWDQAAERQEMLLPPEGIAAEFTHLGQDFHVVHQFIDSKINNSKYKILDNNGRACGESYGLHRIVGESLHFTPLRSTNLLGHTRDHVPHLVRTAIGEIVLQSNDLTWHSNLHLLPPGRRMYESLMSELNVEESRFYGKLRMQKILANNDGERTARYSIKKIA